jgi:hypothetical protein
MTRRQWSSDGGALSFQAGYGERMMMAPIRFDPELRVEEVREVFASR